MPGTVLLLAAAPVGRGRLVDAASVLPVLAAVPPAVLSGTDTATVVELADPLDPQAVLTRLRAAAASPGPLTVFITGQLHLDRRQHLPHLALARTTLSTVRYTGFPWHWLREELRLRPAGATALVADLHADAEMWQYLRSHRLDTGRAVAVHGRIAPPPPRRTVAAPAYMKAVATLLRSGHRPPLEQLHEQALGRLAQEGSYADVVLTAGGVAGGAASGGAVIGGAASGGAVIGGAASGGAVIGGAASGGAVIGGAASGSAAPGGVVPGGALTAVAAPGGAESGGSYGGSPQRRRPSGPAGPDDDPHAAITAAVQAGRHGDADALAARWEQTAVAAHGHASEDALHWAEVRADLAMFAGDPAGSCLAWLAVASTRLAMAQAPDAPAVEAAVDRAHHQWGRIGDPERARELGPALVELRGRVPGRREGALEHVRRQLRELQTQHGTNPALT